MHGAAVLRGEPTTLGPFEVLDRLGEGKMGVVFRARNMETGEQVAVKTVPVPDVALLRSIRREIHALRRLRHPGIVRVFSDGVHDGLPWYSMELLEGTPLRQRLARPEPRVPGERRQVEGVGLPQHLEMLHHLCGALSFLHGEGLVHRDLKPENVILRRDGTPVLMDFGLASLSGGALGRESLEYAGALEGSFGYIAPEQINGTLVDARADLYALGCILYECVTGQLPFLAPGWAVLKQHLRDAPVPPSEWVEGVPPELEALILRLLEKRPRDRLGHASDVAAVLAELGAGSGSTFVPAGRAYLYRPEFAGREEVLTGLEARLVRARNGEGGCVLIGGDSGAGKTRLAMEMATAAHRRALRVVTGECLPLDGSGQGGSSARGAPLHPFLPLLQTLGDHCRAAGPPATEALLGPRGKVLAMYEPSLAHVPGQDAYLEPPKLPAQASRERLLHYCVQTLVAFAQVEPLLLVIDDLQWADELSLSLLALLHRGALREARVLVVGTYRTEEVGDALRGLLDDAPGLHVRLENLGEATVATMVKDMLALPEPPAALTRFLAAQSEGNPFFVAEYLRNAIDEGLLSRDSRGRWQVAERAQSLEATHPVMPLPESLRALVVQRLRRLTESARQLVGVASVLGREFASDDLALVAGLGEQQELEALQELLARRVLEESGGGRLRFSHDKLRESAHEELPRPRRRELHHATAVALEARYRNTEGFARLFPVLAHHWTVAEVDEKSLEYLELAGRHALRTQASREAAAFFRQGLAIDMRRGDGGPEASARRARWERQLGEASYALGDLGACKGHMLRALEGLGQPLPTTGGGWARLFLAQLAKQVVHLLLPPVRRPGARGEPDARMAAALAGGRLAECYYWSQEMLAMVTVTLSYVNIAEDAGRTEEVKRQYAQFGYYAGVFRLPSLADFYFRRAEREDGPNADPSAVAFALTVEAIYHMVFGRWARADEKAEQARALLQAIGDRHDLDTARGLLAQTAYCAGNFDGALRLITELRESARARSNLQHQIWAAYALARCLIPLGRYDESVRSAEDSLRMLSGQADRASEIASHGLLATASLYRGDLARALPEADEVMRLSKGTQPTVFLEMHGYEGAALTYCAHWQRALVRAPGEAAEYARKAWEACARLKRFALTHPLGQPAALRCVGLAHALAGHPRRARAAWRSAVARARRLEMPYEEALAHRELARRAPPSSPERAQHLRDALELFSRLGCPRDVAELEALRPS